MSVESGEGSKNSDSVSYKGSVSGLKGFLTDKLTKIVEGVVANAETTESGGKKIPISMIFPNADQPRQVFDPKSLEELAATMKEVGQAQAITVRPRGTGFEIISGERRYRAARLAGLTHLECFIKNVTDSEAQLLSLVENLQRQDLLPIEEAHYLKKVLNDNKGLSLDKLAKMLGSHKSTLSEKIQLTEVPEDEQKLLYAKGKAFTHRHWRVLSRIRDQMFLKTLLKRSLEEQLSVAELERALEVAGIPKAKRATGSEKSATKEWAPPVYIDGDSFSFKNSSYSFSSLTEEKRSKLKENLQQILQKLDEPIVAAAIEEVPTPENALVENFPENA